MGGPRLVVSDVDGTLVDRKKQLTPATVAAVSRLREAGVGFTIISARPRSGMMPLIDRLGIDGPMAAFNGGIVFHADGRMDAHHVIDEDAARGVIECAKGLAVDTWVFADDRWYASDADGPHTASERITSDQEPVTGEPIAPLLDHADKITFVSDDEGLLRSLHATCVDRYGTQATIVQSQTYYLDVTALVANKGNGIEELARARGVPLADVAAIGDQANDISMLERAGLAIAMGNAPDAVRQVADHVTAANDADGVAAAIDELILSHSGVDA